VSTGVFPDPSDSFGWPTAHLQTHAVRFGTTVLVVGSDNICTPGPAWRASVLGEIWRPESTSWSEAPSLPRPRDRFFAAELPDGSAIVVGGSTDFEFASDGAIGGPRSFRSSLRLVDGSTEWVRSGDLNTARSAPTGSVLQDGRLLIAGGFYSDLPDDPPARMLSGAELFDPATERWSRTGSLKQARLGASAVTLTDGRVLIAGGWASVAEQFEGPDGGFSDILDSAEIFDPASGAFSRTGPLPWAAAEAPLAALPDGGALMVHDGRAARFDSRTGEWSETRPMGLRTGLRTLVTLDDGSVLAAGGMPDWENTTPDPDKPFSARAEIYDPVSDRWTEIAPMPFGRAGGAGVLLADGSVLIAGGWGAAGEPGDPSCPEGALEAVRFIPG
jgi:hypothetical protein